jgi:hypothetical protein
MDEPQHQTAFTNRDDERSQLLHPPPLLNIYGEYGIGKTRLLEWAIDEWRKSGIVLHVKLEEATGDAENAIRRCAELLRGKIVAEEARVPGTHASEADGVLHGIRRLAEVHPVFLAFDTTEGLHSNAAFWSWMEVNIVGPLLSEPQVKQIFAGRIPVPWRRAEVRLSVELLRIERIPEEDESQLIRSAIAARNGGRPEAILGRWINAIARLSYGLPRLVEALAETMTQIAGTEQMNETELDQRLAERVRGFIYEDLFRDVAAEWRDILWWACVPERFDAESLKAYLQEVKPCLAGHEEYYYIKGIQDLRLHYMVVSADARGNRLSGVLQDVVRGCFRRVAPADYARAEQAWQACIKRRQPDEVVC